MRNGWAWFLNFLPTIFYSPKKPELVSYWLEDLQICRRLLGQ